ncbi:alginate export family protein [Ekhidna sp.]|uniref:alginate export family protein n=1 Tax=Ekhidna sp. TaxID=2608089 RepID=UPI003C7B7864
MIRNSLLFLFIIISFSSAAQFKLDAEFRPRFEYRDGYTTLSEPGEKGVFLITQRTRLNASFNDQNRIQTYLSFQDIRTWGEYDLNSTESTIALYQAWAKFKIADRLSLKIGRQEFEYDDLKILSNSTWRLQARSHDAGLLEWQNVDSTLTVHLAGGVNQEDEVLFQDLYTNPAYYKNMGMVWINKKFSNTEISLLFLDLGQQLADTSINHFRTLGIYGVQKIGKTTLTGSFYLQNGSNQADQNVSANMISLQAEVPVSERLVINPGFDILSGTKAEDLQDAGYNETNSFIPLYARRHRYFGIQDMFYVAGFNVPAGLSDYFLKFSYKVNDQWRTRLQTHSFSTSENILNTSDNTIVDDKHLGYEIDLFLDYNPYDNLNVGFGYAHFLPTESMEIIKQRGDQNEIAHFAYLQISYTPTLFKSKN